MTRICFCVFRWIVLFSVSKQRATLIFYKSSLKEKLDVIQGLEKEILDLSTEEEIVRQRN